MVRMFARIVAMLAALPGPIVLAALAVCLAAALPESPVAAKSFRYCAGDGDSSGVCVYVDEQIGTAVVRPVRIAGSSSPDEYFGHWNIRVKNGGQTEICSSCSWSFPIKPGRKYTFSVQGCMEHFLASSVCWRWVEVHYTALNLSSNAAPIVEEPTKPVVKLTPRTKGTGEASDVPICEAAKQARARNSPATAGLAAKCKDFLATHVEAVPDNGSDAGAVLEGSLGKGADLTVVSIDGPTSLAAGLSGTYKVTINNHGDVAAAVDLHIIFAKALDQTDQIVAGGGLDCAVGHDTGINAAVTCNGAQLAAGQSVTVVVQGRGQSAGTGVLLATLNPSHAVQESNYDNNLKQLNVTIN